MATISDWLLAAGSMQEQLATPRRKRQYRVPILLAALAAIIVALTL